eukprot:g484.t1
MSEGDEILFISFKQAGIYISEDVKNIDDFDANIVISVCAQTLKIIHAANGTLSSKIKKLPESLPKNVAARHRVCTNLGTFIKALGYTGETGYNQFLYPNSKDVRNLLLWLIDQLPKDEGGESEAIGAGAVLQNKIKKSLKSWKELKWTPHFASVNPLCGTFEALPIYTAETETKTKDKNITKYGNSNKLSDVTKQMPYPTQLSPSIMQHNMGRVLKENADEKLLDEAGLVGISSFRKNKITELNTYLKKALIRNNAGKKPDKFNDDSNDNASMDELIASLGKGAGDDESNRFKNQAAFTQEQADINETENDVERGEEQKDAETIKRERDDEIDKLDSELQSLLAFLSHATKGSEKLGSETKKYEDGLTGMEEKVSNAEKEYQVKNRTLQMLPNAEENIKKLQDICSQKEKKLQDLACQWEEWKGPMMKEYDAIMSKLTKRKAEGRWKVAEMRRMREEMRGMAGTIREAEERYKLLSEEFKKMPKSINRAVYTYRIMDIIKQIRKQKLEIERIVNDIRSVQRALNITSQKLTRVEAITDEHVFQAAKRATDPAYVKAYRMLANVREIFEALVSTAQEAGKFENNSRDLEQMSKKLTIRNTAQNMERVLSDLDAVKQENIGLAKKIKKLQRG